MCPLYITSLAEYHLVSINILLKKSDAGDTNYNVQLNNET